MFLYKQKIVVTGGSGRFGTELKKVKNKYNLLYPSKTKLNVLNFNNIKNVLEEEHLRLQEEQILRKMELQNAWDIQLANNQYTLTDLYLVLLV